MQGGGTRSLGELARLVGGELTGDPATSIRGLASLEAAAPGDLSFVTGPRYRAAAERSRASALLAPPDLDLPGRVLVRVAHPIAALARLVRVFHPEPVPAPGVHPTAVVAESAQVAADATIMAYAVVDTGSVVAAGAVLHPHVVVGARCRVGEGSVLHAHVVL